MLVPDLDEMSVSNTPLMGTLHKAWNQSVAANWTPFVQLARTCIAAISEGKKAIVTAKCGVKRKGSELTVHNSYSSDKTCHLVIISLLLTPFIIVQSGHFYLDSHGWLHKYASRCL